MEQTREPRTNRPTGVQTTVSGKERSSKEEEGEKKGKWSKERNVCLCVPLTMAQNYFFLIFKERGDIKSAQVAAQFSR